MTRHCALAISALFFASSVASAADEFSSWEWISPKPAGDFLTEIAFDGTRFIGVGDMGVVLTSINGTNWSLAYNDTTNRMYGITVGGPRTVIYGQRGTVLSSDDATRWPSAAIASTNSIWTVAYGLERYVLFDGKAQSFLSDDGQEWVKSPYDAGYAFTDLVFGEGLFVGISGGFIGTSTNGVDWLARDSGTEGVLWSIAYGDGVFVAVGEEDNHGIILTSPDGISWVLQTTATPLRDVAFGEFGFVVTGGGFMQPGTSLQSNDGTYFSDGPASGSGLDSVPNGITCGNGICVAVGDRGSIWTTIDGTNWVSQVSGRPETINSFATDGNSLVGVGSKGAILVSNDGQTFVDQVGSTNEHFMSVVHTGSRYIAVGSKGVIRTRSAGSEWQLEDANTDAYFKHVAHGNGNTVAIGWNATGRPYGQFAVRDLYGNWRLVRPAENEYLNTSIAFGAGRFVAGGYYGEIWTSLDGLSWEKLNLGTGQTMVPIRYLNGRFIGMSSTSIGISMDGLTWSFSPTTPPPLKDIVFGNGLYLGVGYTLGALHASEDALHWARQSMKTLDLSSAAYFRDSFYVSGFILKSRSSLIPEIQKFQRTGGDWRFELFGKIGRDYELQSSIDLVSWQHELDYTQPVRVHQLNRPAGADQRFYRVKLKEP